MKLPIVLLALAVSALASSVSAEEKTCAIELGKNNSEILVKWCINVSPATRPPCNSANSCELIVDEIRRGCAFLKNDKNSPYYCRLTYRQ